MDGPPAERLLVLDGSRRAEAVAGLIEHDTDGVRLLGERRQTGQGAAERLAALLPGLFGEVGLDQGTGGGALSLICVATGPGSFTGLRASLSLAHGLALGWDVPLHGVPAACALRQAAGEDGPPLWCAIEAGHDRIYLQRPGETAMQATAFDTLAPPSGPVRVAGDAAPRLASRFAEAIDSLVHWPDLRALAAAALDRRAAGLPRLPAQPLYGEPPRVSSPGRPPRPPPR